MTNPEGPGGASPLQGVSDDELTSLVDDVLRSGKHSTTPGAASGDSGHPTERHHKRVIAEQMRQLASSLSGATAGDGASRDQWYFEVQGKQLGPVSPQEARALWNDGVLGPDSYCWAEGFSAWIVLSRVTELASLLAPKPDGTQVPTTPLVEEEKPKDWKPAAAAMAVTLNGTPKPAAPSPAVSADPPASVYYVIPQAPEPAPPPARRASALTQSVVTGLVAGLVMALVLLFMLRGSGSATGSSGQAQSASGVGSGPQGAASAPSSGGAPAGASSVTGASASGSAASNDGTASSGGTAAAAGSAAGTAPSMNDAVAAGGAASSVSDSSSAGGSVMSAGGAASASGAGPASNGAAASSASAGGSESSAGGGATVDGRGTSSEMASASSGKPAPIGASRDGASRDGASNDGVADRASADPAGEPASDAASAGPRRTLRGRATRTMVDEEGAGAASSSGETSSEGATRVAASRSPSGASPEVTTAAATATRKPAPGEPGSGEAPPEFGDDAFERTFGGPAERPRRPDIYIPPPPGEPALPQTLSQAQVLQVVVANKAKVQRCVDEHRAQSQETGRLVMRFSIATSGKVQEVEPVSPSHLRDSDLARCLEAQIGDWSFPRHQQVGEPVVMPFAF